VRSPQGQNGAVLNADENGGIVAALAADGTPKVTLESDSGHGLISVYNADGVKVVEAASQASTGDGYYAAWNVQDDLSLILPESVSPQEESAPAEAEAPFNTK
jgi:hypothetical protein